MKNDERAELLGAMDTIEFLKNKYNELSISYIELKQDKLIQSRVCQAKEEEIQRLLKSNPTIPANTKDLQFRINELEETLTELNKRYARTVNIDDFAHKVNSRKPIFKYNDWEKELLVLVKDKVRDMDKPMEKFLIEGVKEYK